MSLWLRGWPYKAFSHLCSSPPNLLPLLNPESDALIKIQLSQQCARRSWHKQPNSQHLFHFILPLDRHNNHRVLVSRWAAGFKGENSWHGTWMRCSSVSCSCTLEMEALPGTAASGAGRGRRRLPGPGSALPRRPLSAALGGAGVGWANTMGDISRVGLTVAGMRWGEITCADKNTGVR